MEEQEMEEIQVKQNSEEPKAVITINNKRIELGSQLIIMLFAIVAGFFMMALKVYGFITAGIGFVPISISVFIYLLTYVGAIWAYIRSKNFSFEFAVNGILFLIAMMSV